MLNHPDARMMVRNVVAEMTWVMRQGMWPGLSTLKRQCRIGVFISFCSSCATGNRPRCIDHDICTYDSLQE